MSILIDADDPGDRAGLHRRQGELPRQGDDRRTARGWWAASRPARAGRRHLGRPVFNTVKDAVKATGAEASLAFVPPPYAADALMEAADAGLRLVCIITDGIPAQDMMRVKRYLQALSEGAAHHGRRPELRRHHQRRQGDARHHAEQHLHSRQRRHRLALRHPGLRGRRADEGAAASGVTTSVGIGGDPINGSSFLDHLMLFEQDPETKAVIMIGEIGGPQEAEAARWVRENMSKPVVGYVAGLTAPKGRRMGHAGAIISAEGDTAGEKAEIMKAYGLLVAQSPAELGTTVAQALAKAK